MEHRMYSVYDAKAGRFDKVWQQSTDEVAIRSFSDAVNDPSTMLNKHPADFTLYQVGTFNDVTGEVVGYSPAIHVVGAVQVKHQQLALDDQEQLQLDAGKSLAS